MTDYAFSPAFIMIIAGLCLPFIHKGFRGYFAILASIAALIYIFSIKINVVAADDMFKTSVAGFELIPVYIHPFTKIFAIVFAIAAIAGNVFALNRISLLEQAATLVYAGSAIGVTFAGDFITMFIYWEVMALASTAVIFAARTPTSYASGMRYAVMHLFGGVVLMSGIAAYLGISYDASLLGFDPAIINIFDIMNPDRHSLAAVLILIGILVNVAAPPFSAWLPDAYPSSSSTGAVFLSAFTTKTAVFALLLLFPGIEVLIYIGVFMIFYGIIMAILENDMRRILAYSIINQVGFMVTGIGIGTELALSGTATHAFCHIIYKALLFMSAGAVMYRTGKTKCTELGGLFKPMKITCACGIIGALSISAFPFTSGFVSKSMISAATVGFADMYLIWLLLAAASAGVFLHAGIKFPWFVFFNKDSGLRPKEAPLSMLIAMVLMSVLCIVPALPGISEISLYQLLPLPVDYIPYTTEHVVTQLQLLLFSGLAFFLLLPLLKRTDTITLDFDWFYRVLLMKIVNLSLCILSYLSKVLGNLGANIKERMITFIYMFYGPDGVLVRNWPIGLTAFWMLTILAVYLLIAFF